MVIGFVCTDTNDCVIKKEGRNIEEGLVPVAETLNPECFVPDPRFRVNRRVAISFVRRKLDHVFRPIIAI